LLVSTVAVVAGVSFSSQFLTLSLLLHCVVSISQSSLFQKAGERDVTIWASVSTRSVAWPGITAGGSPNSTPHLGFRAQSSECGIPDGSIDIRSKALAILGAVRLILTTAKRRHVDRCSCQMQTAKERAILPRRQKSDPANCLKWKPRGIVEGIEDGYEHA
jgi:hypothetical protein